MKPYTASHATSRWVEWKEIIYWRKKQRRDRERGDFASAKMMEGVIFTSCRTSIQGEKKCGKDIPELIMASG